MSVFLRAVPRLARPVSRAFLSPGVLESGITPMPQVGPKRRQCAARLPPSASSSVVESSQPDDGGRSATLLLVAFPLPSRSLLVGPDAAISPRTRTRKTARLVRGPTENYTAGIFRPASHSFASTRCPVTLSPVIVHGILVILHFQVPVDVRTVVFMRD